MLYFLLLMAQKRMLDKKISVSEQVSNLEPQSQLIFTWGIPHADDVGLLPRSHKTLKATIVPMWECTLAEFDAWAAQIVKEGLWREVEFKDDKFYIMTKFGEHQTLKKDRQPQTFLSIPLDKDPKVSWEELGEVLESLGFHLEDSGFQLESEEKRSEEKRSKRREENTAPPTGDALLFPEFWSAYPKKVNKKDAQKAWMKAMKAKVTFKEIMVGLEKWKASSQWNKDGGEFIPHAATWLNKEKWNDEVKTGVTSKTDQF